MAEKSSPLLTPEQRLRLTTLPEKLSQAEIVRYYTLTPEDLTFINRHNGSHNRLGVTLQLCALRYPGRPLTDFLAVPEKILAYVAPQVGVSPTVLARYGQRTSTIYEHLDRLRQQYGYRAYGWSEILHLTRHLLPLAMERDEPLALVENALTFMRTEMILPPGITTTESLVWRVQRMALYRLYRRLTQSLTSKQTETLDNLLQVEVGVSGVTRLAWLRHPPGKPSPAGVYHLLDRLTFLKGLQLLASPATVHPNRVRQLAHHCRRYKAQPLTKFAPQRRYAYLVAYFNQLQAELIDQTVEIGDRWLGDLIRRGRNAQKACV